MKFCTSGRRIVCLYLVLTFSFFPNPALSFIAIEGQIESNLKFFFAQEAYESLSDGFGVC